MGGSGEGARGGRIVSDGDFGGHSAAGTVCSHSFDDYIMLADGIEDS